MKPGSKDKKIKILISGMELSELRRHTWSMAEDIGACFGIGESDVCQSSRRVKDRIRNDKKTWKKNRKDREKNNYVKNEAMTLFFSSCFTGTHDSSR
jgi:hypothetical protein